MNFFIALLAPFIAAAVANANVSNFGMRAWLLAVFMLPPHSPSLTQAPLPLTREVRPKYLSRPLHTPRYTSYTSIDANYIDIAAPSPPDVPDLWPRLHGPRRHRVMRGLGLPMPGKGAALGRTCAGELCLPLLSEAAPDGKLSTVGRGTSGWITRD
ncbi:hypothetical protein C8R43DRAFT_127543 [Mycena crocata]|nr:hypothetical protein C8R43DRAFT_127543 [Mycena crocata]